MGVRRKPTGVPGRSWAVSKQRKSRGCKKVTPEADPGSPGVLLGKVDKLYLRALLGLSTQWRPLLGDTAPQLCKNYPLLFQEVLKGVLNSG